MTDIVERLRRPMIGLASNYEADIERKEAADEIERLRAQVSQLVMALDLQTPCEQNQAEGQNYSEEYVRRLEASNAELLAAIKRARIFVDWAWKECSDGEAYELLNEINERIARAAIARAESHD